MSFRPTVNCRTCDDPLDVYQDHENAYCECCEDSGFKKLDKLDALLNTKPANHEDGRRLAWLKERLGV